MTPPASFARQLASEFNGRLRVRWSIKRGEWHIEQQVERGKAMLPRVINEADDAAVRYRDGYVFVLAVRNGTRMPCPRCGTELRVPIRQFGEVTCPTCQPISHQPHKVRACYWPLDDSLLEHLRRFDPHRDGYRRMLADLNSAEPARAAQEASWRRERHAQAVDDFPQIFNIPQVGYTGREQLRGV